MTSVRNAALLMLANGVSGLPVTDDAGALCGVLTEGDLVRRVGGNWCAPIDRKEGDDKQDLSAYIQTYGWSVEEAMNRNVITVSPDTDVGQIGGLMVLHGIKRVPVVDNGHIVGVVSRCDLLGIIVDAPVNRVAAGDEAIRLAVATRLRADLGLGSEMLEVTVRNAQVSVDGRVKTDIERKAIKTLVESIHGVGGFVDGLSLSG
jgi:CBS domain-containing protein